MAETSSNSGVNDDGSSDDATELDAWLEEWGDLFPDDAADGEEPYEETGADPEDEPGATTLRLPSSEHQPLPQPEPLLTEPVGRSAPDSPVPDGPGHESYGSDDAPSLDDPRAWPPPTAGLDEPTALPHASAASPAETGARVEEGETAGPISETVTGPVASGPRGLDAPDAVDPSPPRRRIEEGGTGPVPDPDAGSVRFGPGSPVPESTGSDGEEPAPSESSPRSLGRVGQQVRRTGELQAQALARMTGDLEREEEAEDAGRGRQARRRVEAGGAASEEARERSNRQTGPRAGQSYREVGVDTGSHDSGFGRDLSDRANSRVAVAVGVLSVLAAIGLVTYLLTGASDTGFINGEGQAGGTGSTETTVALPAGAEAPRTADDLALSTVQLIGLDENLGRECAGSGILVGADGTILTNAHVVTSGSGCEFTSIGVGILGDDIDAAAELRYSASVLAFDADLDLAVLRIDGFLDPQESGDDLPLPFRVAPLGDSDNVELGDGVRILGFPVIGGETITFTRGAVSGFTSQARIGDRALIKTDASISAGNSGGMAVDVDGAVVGIPTKARANESGPAIDCRPLTDTNADGQVDDEDNCVPVGGFLNGIRPINLARPLLEEASGAEPIAPVLQASQLSERFDASQVSLSRPRFSLDVERDEPVEEVVTLTAGASQLCFFADWSGIPFGTTWDGLWFRDGTLVESAGHSNEQWDFGVEGENFWVCIQGSEDGLQAGTYEIGFFLEGELMFVEGIEVTAEPAEVFPVTWLNRTEAELCGLAINPMTDSGRVGLNELDPETMIPVESSVTIDLPAGTVIAEAYDCNGRPVADEFGGLSVEGPGSFVIGL